MQNTFLLLLKLRIHILFYSEVFSDFGISRSNHYTLLFLKKKMAIFLSGKPSTIRVIFLHSDSNTRCLKNIKKSRLPLSQIKPDKTIKLNHLNLNLFNLSIFAIYEYISFNLLTSHIPVYY